MRELTFWIILSIREINSLLNLSWQIKTIP